MQFVNHTPFPAQAFRGVDAQGQAFRVVVLRQTLTWDATGELFFADVQAALCEADEFFEENMQGSVRRESDLCQYKPRCDVIVNGTAHAPMVNGRPVARFEVRLMMKCPDTPTPLPPRPEGLNPWMAPDAQQLAQWQADCEHASRTPTPGERLIDKTLRACGPREFVHATGVSTTVKLVTLGLVQPTYWHLTEPTPQAQVPLRLEHAFGGQCRIEASSSLAGRVPKAHRLTPAQAALHPQADNPPVAHEAFAANPTGCGYAPEWFLQANGAARVEAPQFEYPARPVTVKVFDAAVAPGQGSQDDVVAGLGVRPKGHPERIRQAGTIDQAFIEGDAPLPPDFDFAVWNAAWPDQQTEHLQGDELIGLVNLCAADTLGARRDANGNTLLRLWLPGHLPFLVARFKSGAMGEVQAKLDTLLIEPDTCTVSCVWRATLPLSPAVHTLELRMLEREEVDALRAEPVHADAGADADPNSDRDTDRDAEAAYG